jgi:hypothetical protein
MCFLCIRTEITLFVWKCGRPNAELVPCDAYSNSPLLITLQSSSRRFTVPLAHLHQKDGRTHPGVHQSSNFSISPIITPIIINAVPVTTSHASSPLVPLSSPLSPPLVQTFKLVLHFNGIHV